MDRAYDEKIVLYFYRKSGSSTLFLLLLGFAFTGVGAAGGGRIVFLIIGIAFIVLGVWQGIRSRFVHVGGAEVDESARKFETGSSLCQNALAALEISEEDAEHMQIETLSGYCCFPIDTQPLLRWDEEDQKLRSSNFQRTIFFADKEMFLTYSETKSLVDSEYRSAPHIWRYAGIKNVKIESAEVQCALTSDKDSKKVAKTFECLTIRGENGEYFAYSFDSSMKPEAEKIRDMIFSHISQPGSDGNNDGAGVPNRVGADRKAGNAAGARSSNTEVSVGIIGDAMKDI